MNLTPPQKRILSRRLQVKTAYENKGETLVTALVKSLSTKLGVSEPTVWDDLKQQGLIEKK
jgi:Mn-dependent DtxR family transcriptional regulator